MNWQGDKARLSNEEIAEIRRNMKAMGLSHVFCQACSEEMKPEQARKSNTGLIMSSAINQIGICETHFHTTLLGHLPKPL
jgi:hypothetical protein